VVPQGGRKRGRPQGGRPGGQLPPRFGVYGSPPGDDKSLGRGRTLSGGGIEVVGGSKLSSRGEPLRWFNVRKVARVALAAFQARNAMGGSDCSPRPAAHSAGGEGGLFLWVSGRRRRRRGGGSAATGG